jgi:hypothetical protein
VRSGYRHEQEKTMSKHHTAVAAEAFGAGLFFHAGYSVFIQYGANHPGYDLVAASDTAEIRVNVKGSTDGGWLMTSKELGKSWEACREAWFRRNQGLHFLLVQFQDVAFGTMPRCYLAAADEIAEHMKVAWFGDLDLSLQEHRVATGGKYKGKTAAIPVKWKLSTKRIEEVFARHTEERTIGHIGNTLV